MSFAAKFAPRGGGGGSVAASIIRESAIVFDVRVHPNGKDAFYILQVDKPKFKAFNAAWESDSDITFTDFGVILHRGWGEPGDALKAELREKFGMYGG